MISAITAETFKTLVFDAGMLLYNFNYSSATDAKTLAALIKNESTQKNSWLGATKGGVNVQENRQYWKASMDNLRMPFKGDKRFASAEPKMTGTLVEMHPQNVKIVSGSATVTGENTNIVTVQPTAEIDEGAYLDNVVFVAANGPEGFFLVDMENVLCTSGINFQTADKNIGTLPFEFAAHQDSPVYSNELPVKYLFFSNAE